MKLYHFPLSGHAHRARLFLSLLGLPHEIVHVDLPRGAHKTPEFLKLNSFGQVPVLDDDGVIVTDSIAILVYLAKKYGKTTWLPETPREAAAVQKWLSVTAGELTYGPNAARLIVVFKAPFHAEEVIARAHRILTLIDGALEDHEWIAATTPTIADVALYSYIAQAPEGNVDLSTYSNVNTWLKRVEQLPGFVPFQQTSAGLRTAA